MIKIQCLYFKQAIKGSCFSKHINKNSYLKIWTLND